MHTFSAFGDGRRLLSITCPVSVLDAYGPALIRNLHGNVATRRERAISLLQCLSIRYFRISEVLNFILTRVRHEDAAKFVKKRA